MSAIDAYQADEGMLANFTERVDGGSFTHEISVVRSDLADAALAEALDLAAHWKSLAEQERAKVRRLHPYGPDDLNIHMSRQLAEAWWTRDENGNRLDVDFGEPDELGFYTPTLTVVYEDNHVRLYEGANARAEQAEAELAAYRHAIQAEMDACSVTGDCGDCTVAGHCNLWNVLTKTDT